MGFKCIHKNINVTAHTTRMGRTTERANETKKVRVRKLNDDDGMRSAHIHPPNSMQKSRGRL